MTKQRNTTTDLAKAADRARQLGVFRARDFVAAGFSREYLRRLMARKQVQQLGRGVYAAADFDPDQHLSLVEAAKRVPRGVVCLASALQFHEMGTQAPHRVWLALPRGTNFPRTGKIRFCQFSRACHAFGIEEHKLSGGPIRVYSPAKTVADCFKYRNKYGLDMALEALKEGWRKKKFTMRDLNAAAENCRVRRVLQPYLHMLP